MLTAPDRSHRRETRVANSSQKLKTIQGTQRNGRRRAERAILASRIRERSKKNIRRRCVHANLNGRETRELTRSRLLPKYLRNLCLYLAFISGIRLATWRHLSLRFSSPPPIPSPAHETFEAVAREPTPSDASEFKRVPFV